jgi:hypothetical protein
MKFNLEDYFYEFTILVHLAIFGRKLRGGGRGRRSSGQEHFPGETIQK